MGETQHRCQSAGIKKMERNEEQLKRLHRVSALIRIVHDDEAHSPALSYNVMIERCLSPNPVTDQIAWGQNQRMVSYCILRHFFLPLATVRWITLIAKPGISIMGIFRHFSSHYASFCSAEIFLLITKDRNLFSRKKNKNWPKDWEKLPSFKDFCPIFVNFFFLLATVFHLEYQSSINHTKIKCWCDYSNRIKCS